MKHETIKFESGCERSAEILPYIYREGSDVDCDRFDAHLADCVACRDEFAAISFARYSVYEWQMEEFAPLATPDFVAAFQPKAIDAATIDWFESIRGWFTLPQRLAFSGGFAAILVGIITGAVYLTLPKTSKTEEAATVAVPAVSQPAPVLVKEAVIENNEPSVLPAEPVEIEVARKALNPVSRKTAVKRAPVEKQPSDNIVATVQPAELPRLTEDDDDLDYGLRLADLVADIETREDE